MEGRPARRCPALPAEMDVWGFHSRLQVAPDHAAAEWPRGPEPLPLPTASGVVRWESWRPGHALTARGGPKSRCMRETGRWHPAAAGQHTPHAPAPAAGEASARLHAETRTPVFRAASFTITKPPGPRRPPPGDGHAHAEVLPQPRLRRKRKQPLNTHRNEPAGNDNG